MTMKRRTTDDLNTELMQANSLKKFLYDNDQFFSPKDFPRLLNEKMQECNVSKSELAKAAGMSEVYLHQLLSGRRNPSRTRLVCICIGLGLSFDETQKFLFRAGLGQLYAKVRRDAIIIYGIDHGMDLFRINDLLFDANENTLI